MTSTTETESKSSENVAKDGRKSAPTNWWQWLLLYPAFAVALLTAAPEWFDRIERLYKETFQSGYVEETKLVEFMRQNPECVASPIVWVEATNQTKVDGTICSGTGDVWLRILGANGLAAYKGIDISDLLESLGDQSTSLLLTAAWAGERDRLGPRAPAAKNQSNWRMAQFAIVVCQEFSGDRIIRHLRTGNICYDEIIDSRTGVVISKAQVPCRDSCPPN